jgi:hypothetical protein
MSKPRYEAALQSLAETGAHGEGATEAYILSTLANLGVTDAHVLADWSTENSTSPTGQDVTALTDLGSAAADLARRFMLDKITSWLDVPSHDTDALLAKYGIHLDEEEKEFPGLLAADVIWWSAAFDHAGMRNDKRLGDAPEWYALDPVDGWLAYAAGLSLEEYRDERPTRDTLSAMIVLRSQDATLTSVKHALAAAARVQRARQFFAAATHASAA